MKTYKQFTAQSRKSKMKKYEVELRRTSYITVFVDAKDEVEAESIACLEWLTREHEDSYANWDLESIKEVK